MRKALILIVLIIGLVYNTFGQQYVPFPIANANWNVIYAGTCQDVRPDTVLLRYALHGDTLINNRLYTKLCLETGDTLHPVITGIGGIREADKKIYYRGRTITGWNSDIEELKLYDFNKTTGDTIRHDTQGTNVSKIISIDSVLIGNTYRKRYAVSNVHSSIPTDYIIEGIGSVMNSLLGQVSPIPTCGSFYWRHICFRQNGVQLYLNPEMQECFPARLLASVKTQKSESGLWVHPNPFIDKLTIRIPENSQKLNYRLVDIFGKVCAAGSLYTSETTIDTRLKAGLYLLQITGSNANIISSVKVQSNN